MYFVLGGNLSAYWVVCRLWNPFTGNGIRSLEEFRYFSSRFSDWGLHFPTKNPCPISGCMGRYGKYVEGWEVYTPQNKHGT